MNLDRPDKYDFMSVVDDIFKECKSYKELTQISNEMIFTIKNMYKNEKYFHDCLDDWDKEGLEDE